MNKKKLLQRLSNSAFILLMTLLYFSKFMTGISCIFINFLNICTLSNWASIPTKYELATQKLEHCNLAIIWKNTCLLKQNIHGMPIHACRSLYSLIYHPPSLLSKRSFYRTPDLFNIFWYRESTLCYRTTSVILEYFI